MLTRNRMPDLHWRCHLFYQTRAAEKEFVVDVEARHEDEALAVAERLLRINASRRHVRITYMEAIHHG